MVLAMINSLVCLFWACVFLLLITYFFGIIFTVAVANNYETRSTFDQAAVTEAGELETRFGTLYETMVTLFSSITGGKDWMDFGEMLRNIDMGELYFGIYCFYIFF